MCKYNTLAQYFLNGSTRIIISWSDLKLGPLFSPRLLVFFHIGIVLKPFLRDSPGPGEELEEKIKTVYFGNIFSK